MQASAGSTLAAVFAAAIEVGPEAATAVGVAGMLALLFRVVFRTMSRNDTEMVQLVQTLRRERDRAQAWERYQASRAAHYYARMLGDPNPPPILPEPVEKPDQAAPAPIPPP